MSEFPFTGTTQRHRMPHAEIPGCALVQDLIPLYLDGEVTPESQVLIADHLQRCERCGGYLAGARTVRSQILQEQQAIRATSVPPTSATQFREPVAVSLSMALWQSLMVLIYVSGLLLGLMTADGAHGLIAPGLLGALLGIGGLAGLLIVGSARTRTWLVLMALTAAAGGLLTLLVLTNGGYSWASLAVYGMGMIGLGMWGIWLHYVMRPAHTSGSGSQPLRYGPRQALFTAWLSIVGLVLCGITALTSLIGMVQHAYPVLGMLVFAASIGGIIAINRRRGWFRNLIK